MPTVIKRFPNSDFCLSSERMFGAPYPDWWVAEIIGPDPRYIFERKFLRGVGGRSKDEKYFGGLKYGDILEVSQGKRRVKRWYYRILGVSHKNITLSEVTKHFVIKLINIRRRSKANAPPPPPQQPTGQPFRPAGQTPRNTKKNKRKKPIRKKQPQRRWDQEEQMPHRLLKSELANYYRAYIKEPNTNSRILHLADAVGWMDRALRRTIAQRRLQPGAEKRYGKVEKLRIRASYDTTPAPERELCLVRSIEMLERIIIPDLLPVLHIEIVKQKQLEFERTGNVHIPDQPPDPVTSTTNKTPPSYQTTVDILQKFAEEMANAINAVTGFNKAIVDVTAQMNIIIRGERKKAFTVVGGPKRMRINCIYLPRVLKDTLTGEMWSYKTDSKGYHYIIQKPADINDAVKLAESIANQLF